MGQILNEIQELLYPRCGESLCKSDRGGDAEVPVDGDPDAADPDSSTSGRWRSRGWRGRDHLLVP